MSSGDGDDVGVMVGNLNAVVAPPIADFRSCGTGVHSLVVGAGGGMT